MRVRLLVSYHYHRTTDLAELVDSGRRLDGNVGTATSVMAGLRAAIAEIAAAASSATTTANQASEGSRESAGTVARLAVTMAEIDSLLQTVMFTLYGNQYESREEHLLLTMFQVSLPKIPLHT